MDGPNVTATADEGAPSPVGASKTVRFQCGLLRETERFSEEDLEDVSLGALLEYVEEMLNVKFPEHPYGDLVEKLLLFRHSSDNSLIPLRNKESIRDGDIIEIVLSATWTNWEEFFKNASHAVHSITLSVIASANSKQEYDDAICSHILTVHTYTGAIFCDYCGELLFGLLKQGLKCQGCDKNFHKKCAFHIPNNCTRLRTAEGVANSVTQQRLPQEVWSGRPLWIDRTLKSRRQVPHTFFVQTCKKPTVCFHCKKMLKGVFRQGLRCKDCKVTVHKRCARDIGSNCFGEVPSLNRVDSGEWNNATRGVIANEHLLSSEEISSLSTGSAGGASVGSEGGGSGETVEQREESPASSRSDQEQYEPPAQHEPHAEFPGSTMDSIAEEPSGEDTTSNEGSEHNVAEAHDSADNIKLQRVTGVSFRHTKAPPASVLKEGWAVHYTNKSSVRMKFYWRLDTKCLTLYKSETSSQYHREIQLADMLAVDQMVTPELYPLTPPHVFEIVTSAMTYYVGVDTTGALSSDLKPAQPIDPSSVNLLGDMSNLSPTQLEDIGIGLSVGIHWEEALHAALMPVTPQCSMGSLAEIGRGPSFRNRRGSMKGSLRGSFHGNRGNSFRGGSIRGRRGSKRGSFRVPKPTMSPGGKVPPSNLIKPKVETRLDISLFYQVFPEEILGSGQFGTVYGGQNRHTASPVAVKVIDKMRFPHKHESQLRTEVTILQNLSHPGIIRLEQMFETPERIYVVMEKMNGDMLEMILSSPNSKLDERLTKFMIYQILIALQYLHKKDVVHCDLKPENVLLTSETGMPQTKLCDFGFARIIGEKSFRKSIVGTPAYLAPEVLKNEGYNRSLDLWSVGVIVYVSLSGTFPFNEDEEISDQIQNAAFMYPPDPWANISREAIDMINKLLQVSRRNRFKTTQAINHHWLRDLHLREDLCKLEGKLGMRYLTHDAEDTFWEAQGAKPHPLAAQEAARREAEKRPPIHSYQNVTIPISGSSPNSPGSIPRLADTKVVSNGTAPRPVSQGELVPPLDDRRYSSSSTLRSNDSTPSSQRRSTTNMSDEEIAVSEEHAKRVGYKVSAV